MTLLTCRLALHTNDLQSGKEAQQIMKLNMPCIRGATLCYALGFAVSIMADDVIEQEPLLLPSIAGEPSEQVPAETLPESSGLTLADLESIALAQSPAIARAAALVSAARGDYLQVGLMPNPSVGYDGQQLGSGGRAEQHGVAVGQEIVTAGKLRLNRAAAAQRVEVAHQEHTAARFRVLTDVRVAFYEALVAQRQEELAVELLKINDDFYKMAGQLEQAKEVGRIDVLQANLERQQAGVLMEATRQRKDAAWRRLMAATGSTELAPLPLIGDPFSEATELRFQEALSGILSRSPETAAAAAQVDRAAAVLRRERAEPVPNVTFLGLVNWRDNGINGDPDGSVALSVPLPLFNRNQGAIQRAERELAAARQETRLVDLELQQRLAPVYEAYAAARKQTLLYREEILPQAEEALELTRETYRAGEANFTTLLVAQRTFAITNRDYLDAALRLRTAEAQIEGMLLSGSLSLTPTPRP